MRPYSIAHSALLPEHPLAASALACRADRNRLVLDDVDRFFSSVFDGATILTKLLRCLTERSVIRRLPIELLLSATSVTARWRGLRRRGDGVDSALQAADTAGGTTMGDDRPAAREGPERPMWPLRQRPSLRRPCGAHGGAAPLFESSNSTGKGCTRPERDPTPQFSFR